MIQKATKDFIEKNEGVKKRFMLNDSIIERGDGYHSFYKKVIKAMRKGDSKSFGISLQNSRKYRSYRIKKKRACK